MIPPIDATQTVFGFCTAGVSSLALWIAQTGVMPGDTRTVVETGGTIGFIVGLSYGCITLWKEVQTQRREMAELNKEIRTDWKTQNEKLIVVLERMESEGKTPISHPPYPGS